MRPRADTLLVWAGPECSYGCRFCPIDAARERPGIGATELQRVLASVPVDPERLIVLLGGEPFLNPEIYRLLAVIRSAGFAPGLITTGRPLLYEATRKKLRRIGLAYLRVQLFGVGAEHDGSTAVAGGFEQTMAGLRAWIDEADSTCDIDLALSSRGRPSAGLTAEIESLVRQIASPRVRIGVALDPLPGDPTAGAARHDELPTIALPQPHFLGDAPRSCCLGAVTDLARAAAATTPVTRANSFNFVDTGVSIAPTEDWTTCTAYRAASGGEPMRNLWLVDADRLELHVTDTADFTPAEITRIKEDWSHLFVDRAAPGVLDDFTEGMRRVLPDPICDGCAHRAGCGRRYRVVEGPPFAREEAWIAAHVANLCGRVLDVGCGEQIYFDEIAPLVRSGTVQYTGLDPDELSLGRLRQALPEGRFHLGGIEDFQGAPESYDHILCLRSLNHVTDVDEAFARMTALLVPGGRLLVVENTPFAMLRRAEQVAAADRAPRAGHQHFRNLSSEEALPFAQRHSLRVVHHHPAGLHNTNEWILLLER